ncbi:hypothetical protein B0H10DRAFT_2005619 [Mycena sp. CBHHK59/15]|nr:hypothetical protein B0H10DRAFT_2005619 [Mycena sp. CBHHK59/15]
MVHLVAQVARIRHRPSASSGACDRVVPAGVHAVQHDECGERGEDDPGSLGGGSTYPVDHGVLLTDGVHEEVHHKARDAVHGTVGCGETWDRGRVGEDRDGVRRHVVKWDDFVRGLKERAERLHTHRRQGGSPAIARLTTRIGTPTAGLHISSTRSA